MIKELLHQFNTQRNCKNFISDKNWFCAYTVQSVSIEPFKYKIIWGPKLATFESGLILQKWYISALQENTVHL